MYACLKESLGLVRQKKRERERERPREQHGRSPEIGNNSVGLRNVSSNPKEGNSRNGSKRVKSKILFYDKEWEHDPVGWGFSNFSIYTNYIEI